MIVDIKDLSKTYSQGEGSITIFDNLNFSVEKSYISGHYR
jgi:predicted ABC-type transport system involved in lysophospholipase L1 biosynthesis ATPase subunit